MSNFTKRELVLTISKETGLNQKDVFNIIQKTLDHITEALSTGRNIELRNFGVFEVVLRRSRPGRNPKKPEISVLVPARAEVKFSSGKIMRKKVLELTNKLQSQ